MKKLIKKIYLKITGNYILKNKVGDVKVYKNIHKEAINSIVDEKLNSFFLNNSFDNSFINELAYLTQVTIKKSRIDFNHGKLIYIVLKNYIKSLNSFNDINLVDVGTARGFSSIIMSKVLKDLKLNANIYTFDVIPHNKKIFWNCYADHVYGKQTREDLLKEYNEYLNRIIFLTGESHKQLKKLNLNKINFAFIDGSHKYKDVKKDFIEISKKQSKGDIIFFDDYTINYFNGVVKLVDQIENDKSYSIKRFTSSEQRGYAIAHKI